MRQEEQRGVVVEAGPRAPLEVIQAQFFLELLVEQSAQKQGNAGRRNDAPEA